MHKRRLYQILFTTGVVGIVVLGVWLARIEISGPLADVALSYGYAGYFVAAFIAGIDIIIPVTHFVFTIPLLNAGLNPWALALTGALGATLADMVGYALGRGGSAVFPKTVKPFRDWVLSYTKRNTHAVPLILFLWAAFVPLPNELLVIPAGVARYGFMRTLLITIAGSVVFNILAVVVGGLFVVG